MTQAITTTPPRVSEVLGPTRAPFLLLAISCVLLGTGTAIWTTGTVTPLHVALVLFGGVAAHVSVNAFNEYSDFRTGLDARTRRTPFNGGSGVLPNHPALAPVALGIAVGALAVTLLVGGYFLWLRGAIMLPPGMMGVLIVAGYTPWMTRRPWFSLLAPGLGFGPCMVIGTYLALTGHFAWPALAASLVPFFLVNDLLLLNQFPDAEADRTVGRRHFPILIGAQASSRIYALFLLLGYAALIVMVGLRILPPLSLLGLITMPLGILAARGAMRHADTPERLLPFQGMNVVINLATPVLMAVGMIIVRP